MQCKRILGLAIMVDAESPRTVADILLTRVPEGQRVRMTYDNMCNTVHFIFNRWPEKMLQFDTFIDAVHIRTHTQCYDLYATGAA